MKVHIDSQIFDKLDERRPAKIRINNYKVTKPHTKPKYTWENNNDITNAGYEVWKLAAMYICHDGDEMNFVRDKCKFCRDKCKFYRDDNLYLLGLEQCNNSHIALNFIIALRETVQI